MSLVMNKLNLLLLCFATTSLFSCDMRQEANDNHSIIGQWQNLNNPDIGIEFDAAGNYYLLKSNERLSIENEVVLHYAFNKELDGNNFVLKEKTTDFTYTGKLTFLNKDTVKLSLKAPKSKSLVVELSRIKKQ